MGRGLGAGRSLVRNVDGEDAPLGVHVLQDGRPQDGAAALEGARLDDQVRLHLGDDLLHDPGVGRGLLGGDTQEMAAEDRLALVPEAKHVLDRADRLFPAQLRDGGVRIVEGAIACVRVGLADCTSLSAPECETETNHRHDQRPILQPAPLSPSSAPSPVPKPTVVP